MILCMVAPASASGLLPGAAAPQESYVVGETLARIQLVQVPTHSYILRATIPLPPGCYPRPDGLVPFAIRDSGGSEYPAQVEIVSRYADDMQGADVVEVLACIEPPQGALVARGAPLPTGGPDVWIVYELIYRPHQPGELELDVGVAALLQQPQAVMLRGRDVFGNLYRADLLRDLRVQTSHLRIKRDGHVARQVRTHDTLRPVPPVLGPSGTLPHFLGAHSYVTVWQGEDFISLDLRVHNGDEGLDPTDTLGVPLGKLYFSELELIVPTPWRVLRAFDDPFVGPSYLESGSRVYPIVAPLPDGKLHMMPQQGQFHRRRALVPEGKEHGALVQLREESLGFCLLGLSGTGRVLFSWWNPLTARYFPQKERLPTLWNLGRPQVRAWLTARFGLYEQALREGLDGPFPVTVGALGWAHPWGQSTGYAHGGEEIHLFDGVRTAYAASNEGYRLFQITHRMSTERHPLALYDQAGDAFTMEDWIVQGASGPFVPVYMWMYPVLFLGDPFGFGDSPDFQRQAVSDLGRKPPYEAQLLGCDPIDRAHLIRYTRAPKVLAWLGNDALTKDDLMLQGELARVSYTILPQDHHGGYIYTGLLNDRLEVDANPNTGFAIHRGEGWGADAMTAAFCLAEPEWRDKTRSWFYDLLELLEDGISDCTGIIQGDPNQDTFFGEYRSRQSISSAIMQNALWGVMKSVFGERDPVARDRMAAVLEADLYAMISDLVWNSEAEAPWFYVAVGPYDYTRPQFCTLEEFPPEGFLYSDAYQTWCAFAYGYRLTQDPTFLTFAERMLYAPLTTPALGSADYGYIENRAALIALIQEVLE